MDQQQQIADRLKEANNILVTVSNNPSVDQLASCIGLTLALNKLGKHATAVFSGNVPSTIEFLQPEKTLEKNTDSLRDFIIALDKSKADKLRYKVEDKVVKIFITPYRTSISQNDLDFSQGDFNVDVVIALGVHNQADLDQAITSHGRILHDATVATVNIKPGGELGSINWLNPGASSLSELVTELLNVVDKNLIDGQMATALLTGIVAETARFSNEKTSPTTMSISAELMAAGANQQLVATKLEAPQPLPPAVLSQPSQPPAPPNPPAEPPKPDDGTLEIAHEDQPKPAPDAAQPQPEPAAQQEKPETPAELPQEPDESTQQIHIDEQGGLQNIAEPPAPFRVQQGGSTDPTQHMDSSRLILQPPTMGPQPGPAGMGPPDGYGPDDPLSLPQPDEPTGGGLNATPFTPPASAATAASPMPFMPPSMTPGAPQPQPPLPPAPAPLPPQPILPPAQDSVSPFTSPAWPPAAPAPVPPFATPQPPPAPAPTIPPAAPAPAAPQPSQTLEQIERNVHSPHLQAAAPPFLPPAPAPALTPAIPPADPFTLPVPPAPVPQPELDPDESGADLANAREAVRQAIASQPPSGGTLEPIQALNAQPLGVPLHNDADAGQGAVQPVTGPAAGFGAVIRPTTPNDSLPPPPVPPPMMPPQAP